MSFIRSKKKTIHPVLPLDTGPLPEDTEMSGQILRVTFSNPANGYGVARIRRTDVSGEVVIAGQLGSIMEGLEVELQGSWVRHPDYGRQFQVTQCRSVVPVTEAGIERYLASGILPGVGPKKARQIVAHFGLQTLEILDGNPQRLAEIKGFGGKAVDSICEAWAESGNQRSAEIFLQGLGMTPALCQRIIAKYTAAAAADVVRRNPYRLARDVEGIGFLIADKIASSLNIAYDSPVRLCAGVRYCLEQASTEGHTALPEERLVAAVTDMLRVDDTAARKGIEVAIQEGRVIREEQPSGSEFPVLYFSLPLYRAEKRLADKILRHLRIGELTFGGEGEKDASGDVVFPPPEGITLNVEQEQARRLAAVERLSIVTGGPGVGKTTVVAQILRDAQRRHEKVILAAPTGRAARRMSEATCHEAETIHRMLQYDPVCKDFVRNADMPLEGDMLIVDEVSMLDVQLANSLFDAIPADMRVVLVGDRDQLPSVGPGNVLHDLMDSGMVPVTALTRIYRQAAGSRIITSAHAVNHGIVPELANPPKGEKGDFYFDEYSEAAFAANFVQRLAASAVPKFFGYDAMEDVQLLVPMRRGECGTIALNAAMQEVLNPPAPDKPEIILKGEEEKIFRLGDRVMQIKNNYEKMVFNGEMGRIIAIDGSSRSMEVLFDSSPVTYKGDQFNQLTLCYAVTIHKSQGSEFPVVIMPLLDQHYVMLQRNLLYTGMTRAKKLFILVGSSRAVRTAVNNNNPAKRISTLKTRLLAKGVRGALT